MENNKEKKKITIVTHSGQFHADDIFAVATLKLMLEDKFELKVIRSRDPEIIKDADYVVDVGGVHDEEKNRFDHHQVGGGGVRENGVPYASFGLVWKKYGTELSGNTEFSSKIEQKLVTPIDAYDNGITIGNMIFPGIEYYTIDDIVKAFKVTWKENENELDSRFEFLVTLAKQLIVREIKKLKDKKESIVFIMEAYQQSYDERLLNLTKYYPYNSCIDSMPNVLLVTYPDTSGENWCLQAVNVEGEKFTSKILLPMEWSAKRDRELELVTGVPGSIFCHKDRFFAVAKTQEGIIKLAELALAQLDK
ncbi:MAG: MYG1 family protein [Minisyncoccota bacterium]